MTLKEGIKDYKLSLWSIYPAAYFEVLGEEWLNTGTADVASQYSVWPAVWWIGAVMSKA